LNCSPPDLCLLSCWDYRMSHQCPCALIHLVRMPVSCFSTNWTASPKGQDVWSIYSLWHSKHLAQCHRHLVITVNIYSLKERNLKKLLWVFFSLGHISGHASIYIFMSQAANHTFEYWFHLSNVSLMCHPVGPDQPVTATEN
jgi:hydrogenase maturation factor